MKIVLLFAALLSLSSSANAQLAVPAGRFHNCGLTGSAKPARVKALNLLKNRATEPTVINTAITLDALLAPGDDTHRWSIHDGAAIVGYIVDAKSGGRESVNCQAAESQWKDTHIEIGRIPYAPKNERIIVEISPRWRAAQKAVGVDWSTSTIRHLIGQRVSVTGWIFVDSEHLNAAENTHPGGPHNWRASVIEIHPITAIRVLPSWTR